MSNLLLSVRPKYAEKILSGEKTVELRRRFPELTEEATALLYSSTPVQAVVGYTRIKDVIKISISQLWKIYGQDACVSKSDFYNYFSDLDFGFALILGVTKPFKSQLSSKVLRKKYGIVPPQSYRYLNGEFLDLLSDGRVQVPNRHKRRNRA
jgi:predicted transcriptional regulator